MSYYYTQTVEVSSTLQLQESIGLALKTKVLMLCCMEKMTRTQFLNKNISQTRCVRMEINSRCPTSNKHFSQPCISPDPQSLPAIAKSQFHFQGIFKFFVHFTDHPFFFFFLAFLTIQSRILKWKGDLLPNFLFQRQQTAIYCSISVWKMEIVAVRNAPGSLQCCCLLPLEQQWSPVMQNKVMF